MSNVDKYKVITNRLNDDLIEIDKQLFNIKQQLDDVNQQRNKKLEEISFNNLSIQNIMHHENPSLGYLSFDSIKILLSYLAKHKHELLYCMNKHFRAYKLSTYYYKLTKAKSIDFYFNNNGFRDNLLKSVLNPSQQISLQFVNNVHVSDIRCLANVHSLILKGCTKVKDVSSLGNIHYLDLTGTKGFRDISALTNVHTLILDDCSAKIFKLGNLPNVRVFKITNNKQISDLSSLTNLDELVVSNCKSFWKISNLVNVKTLKLSDTSVADFNNFNNKNLNVLELTNCPFRFDIEQFKTTFQNFNNMELLQIKSCRSIGDVENLNHIEKLLINFCTGLTTINVINDSKEVTIENCSNLVSITNISNVESKLIIRELGSLETISGIRNVDTLALYSLRSLTTVENVTGISKVQLQHINSLSNLTFLIGNPLIKLEISNCSSLIDISYLGSCCPDVTLEQCDRIIDISSLTNCHRVVIINCKRITDVSSLGNVHDLTISYQKNSWNNNQYHLTGVSSLGKVHTLKLDGLDIADTDIATLGTVKTLHLSRCNNIVDVNPLVTVEKLTLYSMRSVVDVSLLRGMKDFTHTPYTNPYNTFHY